jgi:F-type H+-transporting ATPase subunit b
MSGKKLALVLLLFVPLFLAMSSEEGASHSGSMGFLGKVINFVILFGGLGFLMAKPLKAFLKKRTEDVKALLEGAESARNTAETRTAEVETRLAGIKDEISRMRTESETRARQDRDRLFKKAEEESARIRRLAGLEIEGQTETAVRELRKFVAERTTDMAREEIKKELTPSDQARLIDQSIERLSKLNEKLGSG